MFSSLRVAQYGAASHPSIYQVTKSYHKEIQSGTNTSLDPDDLSSTCIYQPQSSLSAIQSLVSGND